MIYFNLSRQITNDNIIADLYSKINAYKILKHIFQGK